MEAISKWFAANAQNLHKQKGPLAHRRSRGWNSLLWLAVALWIGVQPAQAAAFSEAFSPQSARQRAAGQITIESPVGTYQIYVVQAGDTLSAIAAEYGITVQEIVDANGLANENELQIGQELRIPSDADVEVVSTDEGADVEASDAEDVVQSGVTSPTLTSPALPSPTLPVLPDNGAALAVCAANSRTYALNLPFDPMRILFHGDRLYLLADGDLFYLPLSALGRQNTLTPISLMPEGRSVGRFTIRELSYVTVDVATGDLLLLDKSDDIYRFNANGWSMAFAAEQIPGQFPDQQYLAIHGDNGVVTALDSDLTTLWRLTPGNTLPSPYLSSGDLLTAVDLAMVGYGAYAYPVTLTLDGTLEGFANSYATLLHALDYGAGVEPWPAQLLQLADGLALVEGQTRQVIAVDVATGAATQTIAYRFPGMQRLRSFAIGDGAIYAVAGSALYVAQLADLVVACPTVTFDDTIYYDGLDLLAVTPNFQLPAPGELPMRPRSYPGARRLYRNGIHEGVDYYSTESVGISYGAPVGTVGDGVVTQIDHDYVEMTPAQFAAAIAETKRLHMTTLELMNKFLGRQVHIQHNEFVESVYAHLSDVAATLEVGAQVQAGDTVGNVGVSGTSSGANGTFGDVHLHFGIMVNGRYLGQGLSLYETWRLWDAIFATPRPQRAVGVTATPIPSPTATLTQTAAAILLPTATPNPTTRPTAVPQTIATVAAPTSTPIVMPRAPQRPAAIATAQPTATTSAAPAPAGIGEAGSAACQRPPDDYALVEYFNIPVYGVQMLNARTVWMLELADFLYDGPGDPLAVVQGSYSTEVDASFGTHAGGGAVDISIREKVNRDNIMTNDEAHELVIALRQAGFAAWVRQPEDLSPPTTLHIHAIAIGDAELSDKAARQLTGPEGYFRGLDGVPPDQGGPKLDWHGGPIICPWMTEIGYEDLR